MYRRNEYFFRQKKIIEVEEFLNGNFGSPGSGRQKKEKPTPEQMAKVNAWQKAKRCRHRLLEYFSEEDLFITLTYKVENRPEDMKKATTDFQKFMRQVRREYKKRGRETFWIRNIEKGTKGAWHIHLILNEIGDSSSIVKTAWKNGGIYLAGIGDQEEDVDKLAAYLTKDENTVEKKKDGSKSKPRIAESSYSTSRNMPLKKPKVRILIRWKEQPAPKKGYTITKIWEGVNPVTGCPYRRYTMIRD